MSSPRRLSATLARIAVVAALSALGSGAVAPAAAAEPPVSETLAGEVALGHTCRWSSADFTIAAQATIPTGSVFTVTTTSPAYNLFRASSDTASLAMTKMDDATWQARAIVPIPAGTVATIATSGFAIPAYGSMSNSIAGLGARYSVGYANGKGPC